MNDNFASSITIGSGGGTVSGTNVDATTEPGEPDHLLAPGGNSVWWKWTAPGTSVVTIDTSGSDLDTVVAIYTGAAVNALTLIADGDDTGIDILTSRVAFQATGGVTYHIAVDGFDGDTGAISLSLQAGGAIIANDHFASPTIIAPTGGSVAGTNATATRQPGEPTHGGKVGGRSVWWSWTAPASMNVSVDTLGSDFDTLLAVYQGSSLGNLTLVDGNDDDGAAKTSRVSFGAIAGNTYQIAVDGYYGASGAILLTIEENIGTPPDNDNFADRVPVAPAGGSVTGESTDATKEPGEPAHAGNTGQHSVWWSWTPNVNATVSVSTAGSDFDTLLAVYTGSAVGALSPVAANDDENGIGPTSYATFDAVAGTTYQIAVDGYDGESGAVTLTINPVTSVPGPASANPAPAITSREFVASWSPVGGASGYLLDVSTSSTFSSFLPGYQSADMGAGTLRVISGLSPSTNYHYRVRAYNSIGQGLPSQTINVTTKPAAFAGLVNLSTRAFAGSGDATLVAGFYIAGTGTKTLILRGLGPKLLEFEVPSVVADPTLVLYDKDQNVIETNNDWDASLASDFAAVGAVALDVGSKDAAMKVTLGPGLYSVHLVNAGPTAEGVIEVYDRSKDAGSRLVNLSCRLRLNAGQTIIVGAFLENKIGPLIIRNVGPTLASYIEEDVLPDPEMRIFIGETVVGGNDDWELGLQPFFAPVGAFDLNVGSRDAALRPEMVPGLFSVHATGKDQAGVTLVELYESP